jgi:hypothetical protein
MGRCVGVAATLPESDRKDLAVLALARSARVSDLAARHGVSRKFVYQQSHKARTALDDAFTPTTRDDAVLFELTVSRTWLRQVIVGLALICHSSYRGIGEFLRDLLGVAISVGTVHDVLQAATQQAGVINREQDLSGIRVGLHDEIFHSESRCWPVSMPTRRIATCWLWRRIATPTPGVCIYWMPPGKGSVLSSTFRLSFLVAHISVQKMASAAMKRRAWSSGRMVRPNGPVDDQRLVCSDQ